MKLILAQLDNQLLAVPANFALVTEIIDQYQHQVDLIVFPPLLFTNDYIASDYDEQLTALSKQTALLWSSVDELQQPIIYLAENGIKKSLAAFSVVEIAGQMFRVALDQCDNEDEMIPLITLNRFFYNYPLSHPYRHSRNLLVCSSISIINDGRHFRKLLGYSGYYHNQRVSNDISFETQIIMVDMAEKPLREIPLENHLLPIMQNIVKMLDKQCYSFSNGWLVGLSGGLDSSVVAALLVSALGANKVSAINLPSRYNSQQTQDIAASLAAKLNIKYQKISIEALANLSQEVIQQALAIKELPSLVLENSQARLRYHLLAMVAAYENKLVTNNTNKVESILGYGTLNGDTSGALAFIADLTKEEVSQLGKELNDFFGFEVVSRDLLFTYENGLISAKILPSAELRFQQVDPMKWGYHDFLVKQVVFAENGLEHFLQAYYDGSIWQKPVAKFLKHYGLADPKAFIEDLNWFYQTMQRNVFKRAQHVPMIVLTNQVFGLTHLEHQGAYWENENIRKLKGAILNEKN